MPPVAIITDSDSSIPAEVAARYDIRQVPISVNFGSESFQAGVNIDDRRVFERIDREKKLPTTAAPSAGQFSAAFQAAFNDGYQAVVCICVSSEVSATYNAALAARDLLNRDITVIDSRSLSLGQGYMVLAAAEAAKKGAAKEQVIAAALNTGRRTHFFGALSTLKYLAMSGRVGHLAAGMAGLLNIQPILTIRNGKLEMLERIRTRKKALGRLIELATQAVGNHPVERMALLHVNALEETRQFENQLRAALSCPDEIMVCELGAGLSVHSGSGLISVAIVLGE